MRRLLTASILIGVICSVSVIVWLLLPKGYACKLANIKVTRWSAFTWVNYTIINNGPYDIHNVTFEYLGLGEKLDSSIPPPTDFTEISKKVKSRTVFVGDLQTGKNKSVEMLGVTYSFDWIESSPTDAPIFDFYFRCKELDPQRIYDDPCQILDNRQGTIPVTIWHLASSPSTVFQDLDITF